MIWVNHSLLDWTTILTFVGIEGEYLEFCNEFLLNTYTLLFGQELVRVIGIVLIKEQLGEQQLVSLIPST